MYLIVGRRNCEYCDKAKELLDSKEIPYVYVDMMETQEKSVIFKDILLTQMNQKTVPQIFKLVGGYDHLNLLLTHIEGINKDVG